MRHDLSFPLRLRAAAPLSHGSDESTGNAQLFRRIAVIHQGRRVEIPAVSGNSFRGQLRRIAAARLLDVVGAQRVTLEAFQLLTSGGAIEKGESKTGEAVAANRDLRALVPMVGLFGGAWKAQLLPGSLRVGWLWPVCAETSRFTGVESFAEASGLLANAFYTRRGDDQMIFETEALAAGVELAGSISVAGATALELDCLADAVAHWRAAPTLGGHLAKGHGVVAVESCGVPASDGSYLAHCRASADAIVAALTK